MEIIYQAQWFFLRSFAGDWESAWPCGIIARGFVMKALV